MVKIALLLLLYSSFSLISYGQLFGEFRHQKEVESIIFNQRQFGVQAFTLKVKNTIENGRGSKKKFHYTFLNDSTFQVREGLFIERYTIRNGEILEPTFQRDSTWLANYNKDKIYTETTIDGVKTNRVYQFSETDTVLIHEDAFQQSGNTTTRINKYFVDTNWRVHKSVYTQLSDSSSNQSYFDYTNNYWCKRHEIIETTTTVDNRQYIRQRREKMFDCGPTGFGKLIDAYFEQVTVTCDYSKDGLLNSIEITSSENHFPDKTQLIVQQKRLKSYKK